MDLGVFFRSDQGFQIWHDIVVEVIQHSLAQMVLIGDSKAFLALPPPQDAQKYHADGVTILHVLEQESL
ncbi:hypothetical protein D3C78_1620550 [compost metagenome]